MQHWGKLMNDELAAIAGKHEQLVGMLQEKYGIAKDDAKNHVVKFKKIVSQIKKANLNLVNLKKSSVPKRKNRKKTAPVK